MKHITSLYTTTYDNFGKPKGFLETRKLTLYEKSDKEIPSGKGCYPSDDLPCLCVEEFDYEISNQEIMALSPVAFIKLTPNQVEFFKKYNFSDEQD